jgi:acetyl esterase/lipase
MFMACGQEKLTDEAYYLAQRAARAGTTVQFSQYDALPHNFAYFFPKLSQSKHVLRQLGLFCHDIVKNNSGLGSRWVRYTADDADFLGSELSLPVSLDEVHRKTRMQDMIARRKSWTGPTETALL